MYTMGMIPHRLPVSADICTATNWIVNAESSSLQA